MKLLVATDQWFPDYRGGSARLATETADRLAAAGHDVTVLAPKANGRPAVEERGRRRLLRVMPRNAFPQTFLDGPAVWRAARRVGDDYDLLLSHHPTAAVGLKSAQRIVPLVHVFHASPRREARLARAQHGWGARRFAVYPLEPVLAGFERLAVRRATRVFVLSEYSRRLVMRDHASAGGAVRVLPAAVDVDAFSPADGREAARRRLDIPLAERLLVAVRRLDAGVGLEALLSAFAQLTDPRLRLALVGSGPMESRLRLLARSLGDRVSFPGEAGHPALADWYRAADLVIVSPAPHEGFGLAAVEALACGTPVVGAAMGATPSVLQPLDDRLVARTPDARSLAGTIAEALALGGSDSFRQACREYAVNRFSWRAAFPVWERELEAAATFGENDDKTA